MTKSNKFAIILTMENQKNTNVDKTQERRNRIGAGVLLLSLVAGGLIHEVTPDKPKPKTKASQIKSDITITKAEMAKVVGEGSVDAGSILILRPGVNFRTSPKITKSPDDKPSNENVAFTLKTPIAVENPINKDGYLVVPDGDRFLYVSSDVIGEKASNGNTYGEYAYPESDINNEEQALIIKKGELVVDEGKAYMQLGNNTAPVAIVHTFTDEGKLTAFLAGDNADLT